MNISNEESMLLTFQQSYGRLMKISGQGSVLTLGDSVTMTNNVVRRVSLGRLSSLLSGYSTSLLQMPAQILYIVF